MFVNLSPEFIRSNEEEILAIAADVPREYWTLENFLYEMPRKWELSFAVKEGAEFIGYVIQSDKSPPHIHHFMVRQDHRSSELGAKMLAEAERRSGLPITLKVAADNTGAQRFYQRHGFVFFGEPCEYLWMRKG